VARVKLILAKLELANRGTELLTAVGDTLRAKKIFLRVIGKLFS